ncbi:MAG TPA: hypothetical protein VGX37_01440 [Allosphingosinicella sp.]|jgi:hypothetical protein|nr:hypothetical protein [Allosphingosinicella sp.]
MHKLLLATTLAAAASAAFAAPASAERRRDDDRLEERIERAIPPAEEVEAMAPALDRSIGALMNVDVGPILDAADPWRRRPGYGRPGRTLGELGRRDDPYFEERVRSSVYGATADMSRMMGAFSAAAPALAQSIRQVEEALDVAVDDYHRRRGDPPRRRWEDDDPYRD